MKGGRGVIVNPNTRRPVVGTGKLAPNMVPKAAGAAIKNPNQRQPQSYR